MISMYGSIGHMSLQEDSSICRKLFHISFFQRVSDHGTRGSHAPNWEEVEYWWRMIGYMILRTEYAKEIL